MATAQRDPVSITMDGAARQLLERAYNARGGWAATRLQDPTAAQIVLWLASGVNILARDPVAPGGLNARSRWGRAFVRALWYQHKWYSGDPDTGGWRDTQRTTMRPGGIQVEIGPHRMQLGVIPAGRVVRVRLGHRPARPVPTSRWAWAEGDAERWGDPSYRDWAAFG